VDTRTIALVFIAASLSTTAATAQRSDAFDACARETDSAARLACFDREIAARRASQASAALAPAAAPPSRFAVTAPAPAPAATVKPPAAPAAASTPAASTTQDIGLDARQARRERRERGEPEPPPPAPIVARVVRIIPREPLIYAFELDNGQIWEQTESTAFSVKPQDQITIRPGVLGAFFLKSADGSVVRAHRVK
jgi:Tfp pilus assembly protein FimV